MKFSSRNAWLVDEEVSMLGTITIQEESQKLYHENLLLRQKGINHENFRPQKIGAIQ